MWAQGCVVWDVGHRMWDVHCKYVDYVRCFPFLLAYVLSMPGVWVKKDVEGAEWSFHKSVSAAAGYLGEQGVKLHDAQVNREAKRNGARNGWRFTTNLNTVAPRNATVAAKPCAAPSIPSDLAGANRVCGACEEGTLRNVFPVASRPMNYVVALMYNTRSTATCACA